MVYTPATCEIKGYQPINSISECNAAAEKNSFSDTVASEHRGYTPRPYGCYWKFNGARLWFNKMSRDNCNGAQSGRPLICRAIHGGKPSVLLHNILNAFFVICRR